MNGIALDPGKATGIAYRLKDACQDVHKAFHLPEDEAMDWLRRQLQNPSTWSFVACETIIITVSTAKKSQDVKASLRQIGVAQHLCRWAGVAFILQQPSDRKFGENLLERLGWYTRGSDHARSASGHLVAALAELDQDFLKRLVPSEEGR